MAFIQAVSLFFVAVYISPATGAVPSLHKGTVDSYFAVQGTEKTLSCTADNVDKDYEITWSCCGHTDIFVPSMTNKTGEHLILNSRQGTNVTSSITFKKPDLYRKRVHVFCRLYKNGALSDDTFQSFDFRYLPRNNLPRAIVSSKEINLDYGQENVNLTCTVTGNLILNKLNVQWLKDGSVIKEVEQSAIGKETTLDYIIEKSNSSTGGLYKCRAYKMVRGFPMQNSSDVNVKVYSKLLGKEKKDQYSVIGEEVQLSCDIDGYPLSITWQKKIIDYKDIISSSHMKVEDGGKTLTIVDFSSADQGGYQCKSKDKNNYDIEQKMKLMIKVLPRLKQGSKANSSVLLLPNKPQSFKCEITAEPVVCVSWTAYDPKTKKYIDLTNSPGVAPPDRCQATLQLTNISVIKDGLVFSCYYKEQGKDEIRQSFVVMKMSMPRLTGDRSKEVKSDEGDDVTLTCDIEVYPSIIEWSVGDKVINGLTSSKYKISKTDPGKLQVIDVEKSDRGSFYCMAKNELNKDGVKQEIILRVKNPVDWVWPVIGIIIVAIVVALVIGFATYRMRRRRAAQEAQDDREMKQAAGIHEQDGAQDAKLLTS